MHNFKLNVRSRLQLFCENNAINPQRQGIIARFIESLPRYVERDRLLAALAELRDQLTEGYSYYFFKVADEGTIAVVDELINDEQQLQRCYQLANSARDDLPKDNAVIPLIHLLFEQEQFIDCNQVRSICLLITREDFTHLISLLDKLDPVAPIDNPRPGGYEAIDFSDCDEAQQAQAALRALVAVDRRDFGEGFDGLNTLLQNSLSAYLESVIQPEPANTQPYAL